MIPQRGDRLACRCEFDGMQRERLRHVNVSAYCTAVAIELDHPSGRPRRLLQRLRAHPERIARNLERINAPEAGKLAEEFPIPGELLNPAVFAVSNVDGAVRRNLDRVRKIKFAGAGARSAPLPQALAGSTVFEDTGVSVPIGN